MLEMTRTDPEFKDKIITGDETRVYGYDPETKRQSAEWRGQDIAPNDFFLFPKLKAVLKGRHFDTREDIIEKSLLALKSIPKEAYKNCFDNWEKRWRWTDRVKKPLEPPYEGPFPVLERTDKYFTLKVKGKNVTTSIDRLRPAYLLADSDNITAEHPTATRPIVSGALPSTSSQQNPDPPDVEKYTEFQGTGSAPDLTRTRSGE
ncbi:hypothetical protein LAZ67_15002570 [Cordylochernes scorpioides]|uniref:Uncharacterized protein n=1 Tax=Cordylochernes scorpioides TaxID=51811 RepID=A0ABY6L9N7_9ARAC|nr:hypothetical protein LAZ67_15002570 [Cordylochernes scorpioides]